VPPTSQIVNPVATVTRTTSGASFIPTSVIRNMAGQRTVDDKYLNDGRLVHLILTTLGCVCCGVSELINDMHSSHGLHICLDKY